MESSLKFSYYNFIIPVEEKSVYIVYNTINNSLIEVPWEIGERLETLGSAEIHFLPDHIVNSLKENGNIIPESTDEQGLILTRELFHRENLSKESTAHIVMALTNSCNMRCIYCYEDVSVAKDNLNIEKTKKAIAKVIDNGIKRLDIRWFGGEPLLKAGLLDELSQFAIEMCNERNIGYSASIITNGTLLNKKNWDILLHNRVRTVQVTIDGGASTHNIKRKLPGRDSFDLILNNLSLMPDDSFDVILRINADKEVFKTLPELFHALDEKELWPQKLKNIKIDFAQKFYFKGSKQESIDLYYTSYEYQVALKEFMKMKLERINIFNEKKNKKKGRIVYSYPTPAMFYCNVTENNNNMVIDGRGALYKCYTSIGSEVEKIGSIDNFELEQNMDKSLCNFNKIALPDCKACKVLPICEQNCNYAIATKARAYTCSSWKFFIEERMKGYYLQSFHKE